MTSLLKIIDRPYVLLTFAPLFWAGNIVLARAIIESTSPVGLAFWRWTTALLILLPVTWPLLKQDWSTAIRHWKILTILSLLGISAFNTLLYVAVQTTTAINGSLMQSSMPAVIIVISLLLFGEKISSVQLGGVGISILGAAIIVLRGDPSTFLSLAFVDGDLWMALAVVLYALYSALLRNRPSVHPLSFLTVTFALGSMALLPLYLGELWSTGSNAIQPKVALTILYLAVFPSILAYLCWNRGIEIIGANRGGLFINLIPVFASVLAIAVLGESLQTFHFIGMGLIFFGMVLFNRRQLLAHRRRHSL
ncbi:MAG: DMT family transporter [Acidiferrobacterales bacterium]